MDKEQEKTIRDAFVRELGGAGEAKTALVTNLSEQGIRLVEHRKKIMELVITVSAAFIATPELFDIDIRNEQLYYIGLVVLIFNIIFVILHLRESLDVDEARSVGTITKLLGVIERRIDKLKI